MKYPNTPTFNSPFEFDMHMLEPVHAMMRTGIRIDQEEKKRLQEKAVKEWHQQQAILDTVLALEGGKSFNVESKKWVPILLYDELKLPVRKKQGKLRGDEEALRELMAICRAKYDDAKTWSTKQRYADGYISCRQIINIRKRRKQISSFLGLKIKAGKLAGEIPLEDPDGRIRGTISVQGTKTARFSHSKTLWGTGINLATVPDSLKSMFIADEGYELCEVDLNRGESWVYAHLSEDPELLRIHTGNLDFHSETAAAISIAFGDPKEVEWIIANKKGDAYKLRYSGKRVNHASAYRMKAHKGAAVVNKEADETGITMTVAEFEAARQIWLQKYFMVESNWWRGIENQLEKNRTLVTPYGRTLTFHDRLDEKTFREATAWVPQSTSVDYLNRGFLRVYHEFEKKEAWGLKVLTQTHDSILFTYRIQYRDEAIQSVVSTMSDQCITIKDRTFSIPIEASCGQSWKGLKPYAKVS